MKSASWTLLVSLVVVTLAFACGITDGHIGLDDWGYTGGCPFVRGGLSRTNVARAFTDFGYGAIWMPLTFLSYMTDVSVLGGSWKDYHAVNVAFHLVNLVLVCCLVRQILARFAPAQSIPLACTAAALLWALHPMRAEAVTLVASRKEELWTLFALFGLISFEALLDRATVARYAVVFLFFSLSCLCKPTAMCFPFLAMAIAYLGRRLDRRTWILLAPLFLLSLVIGWLAVNAQAHPTNAASVDVYGTAVMWRVLNAVVAVGLYGWHTVCPAGVHIDYRAVFGGWPVDGCLGISSFVAVVSIGGLAFVRAGPSVRRLLIGAGFLFAFSLGPTLGVFGYVNGDQAMADRYAYLPHVAFALMAAYGLSRLMENGIPKRWIISGVAALVLAELVVLIPVIKSYEDDVSAFSRALAKDPEHWRALRVIGNAYCARENRLDEGIGMLRKSLRLRRSQLTADSLAYVLAFRGAKGDFEEVKRLGSAVVKDPRRDVGGMMLDALGIVRMREGDFARAADCFSAGLKASRRNHSTDYSRLYLGQCLANVGRRREAIEVLSVAEHSRIKDVAVRSQAALSEISRTEDRTAFVWR